jgi:histone H4
MTSASLGKGGKGFFTQIRRKDMSVSGTLDGISKPSIRRLGRRAGVKRLNNKMYETMRKEMQAFLSTVLHDALIYTTNGKRHTIQVNDVLLSLMRNGRKLYAYGAPK